MEDRKENVYIYPMSERSKLDDHHPYVAGIVKAISGNANICNLGRKPKIGVFDFLKYRGNIDILYLNWIEDLGFGRLPFFQVVFLTIYIYVHRLMGKKLVWTHHNVCSHSGPNKYNSFLQNLLFKQATHIIIHTNESRKFIPQKYWQKLHYFFHPITDLSKPIKQGPAEYDLLIWSSIRRSKGVEVFLKYLKDRDIIDKVKIKIIGKINDESLRKEIIEFQSSNIIIQDRFINNDELQELHSKSRFVFFSYTGGSVLNSGVVVKSLPLGTRIIGPNKGAFVDLHNEGLIQVYDSFEDVIDIISNPNESISSERIRTYCKTHSWNEFGLFLKNIMRDKYELLNA